VADRVAASAHRDWAGCGAASVRRRSRAGSWSDARSGSWRCSDRTAAWIANPNLGPILQGNICLASPEAARSGRGCRFGPAEGLLDVKVDAAQQQGPKDDR